MDRELDVDSSLGELIVDFSNPVLGLRDRHSVARDDDNLGRVLQQISGVARCTAFHRSRFGARTGRLNLSERTKQDVGK